VKFWWLTGFRRLAEERSAIDALAGEGWFALGDWTLDGYRLAVDGVITARGAEYPVRLIYPDQFPLVPAWVEPREEARWSDHQYGEGVLCLEHRPDNWTAGVRGADMLRSVSPVSTRETFLAVSRREDFWFIAAARSEDEQEIRAG